MSLGLDSDSDFSYPGGGSADEFKPTGGMLERDKEEKVRMLSFYLRLGELKRWKKQKGKGESF